MAGVVMGSLAFQPALARHDEAGQLFACTEMADADSGQRLADEGRCDEQVTPASTFNIVVSLMGYDSGILRDEHAPALSFKPGYAGDIPSWRAETDPTSWLKNSVLWYAQQVTAHLGQARLQSYVTRFGYGNRDVSGDPGKENGLTMSWVASSLKISPVEQVAFLRKMLNRRLPVSANALDMTARIMPRVMLANGWEVHGKTGTASPVLPNGKDDETRQYGWYVGWAKKGQRTVVFARLVLDRRQENSAAGPRAKEAFLSDLARRLETL
ncbi:class D beta-lactamase [Massilia sp. TWP1-3-3]|uniref:class D beta-lactamase n=1 Tax=Massilia sp. TWP1-3-3 TaxID=2804573 RepID=UPI003CF3C6C0